VQGAAVVLSAAVAAEHLEVVAVAVAAVTEGLQPLVRPTLEVAVAVHPTPVVPVALVVPASLLSVTNSDTKNGTFCKSSQRSRRSSDCR
tara:strand:- start:418 stop:684 length:267 start_codon:yes stop_codon:yes gene_type:complete